MHAFAPTPRFNAVSLWLISCLLLIFAMAVIGAITRLTESGLSIMEWAPIRGSLPPLSEAEWQRLFSLYQQTDEFKIDNADMDMAGFKAIFWWEWIHRFWGRAMGLVFGLGLLWFWVRGALPSWIKPALVIALILGGLQGTVGWFMVASGFDDGLTDVSHYRLALHLSFALTLYGFLLWITLKYLKRERGFFKANASSQGGVVQQTNHSFWVLSLIGLLLLCVLIVSGAFVAGKNAGLIYNDWPTMGGNLIPPDYQAVNLSFWGSVFSHDTAIQFNHRWLAAFVVVYTLALGAFGFIKRKPLGALRLWLVVLLFVVCFQFLLGIATLAAMVPVSLGALHQAGAISLLTAYISLVFLSKPENPEIGFLKS